MTVPPDLIATVRCEECELEAARLAYRAGLGASEWEAFIDRVPLCDGCTAVGRLLAARLSEARDG